MVCLGIDPGFTRIGYGLIIKKNSKLEYISSGLLAVPAPPKINQLVLIEKAVSKLILSAKPKIIGLEKLFFTNNQKTALAVAQARGIILAAALKHRVKIIEISPSQVKKSITGNGRASKKDIEKMIGYFLSLPAKKMIDDEVDALAIAVTASYYFSTIDI